MSGDDAAGAPAPEAEPRPDDAVPIPPRRQTPLYRALSAALLRIEAWLRSHGGTPLRWGIRGFWALLIAVGVFLLTGPVINQPLTFDDITGSASEATDTWFARSFAADYTLTRDDDGRLTLGVEERIDAFYPDDIDETSLERVIATQYESHDLALAVDAVELDGESITPTVTAGATQTTIALETGERLSGDHTVVLRYTLHDVAFDTQDASSLQMLQLLQWDIFGPDWSHGSVSTTLTLTVPNDLVDRYARDPSAGFAWLLVSDSVTMTPDRTTADATVYVVDLDDTLPPYASFWFAFRFTPDTFAMPAPSLVYWVQVIGPFVPLAILALTVLLALAARAVAWADARGRAWFVSEDRPRPGSTPHLDARIWGAARTGPLISALAALRDAASGPARAKAERNLVRIARRTGRWGDLPAAWTGHVVSPWWTRQFSDGLRRVPRGFVRDAFIGAALGWTAIQWGLVRQLSYQVALSVYWWPVAIVCVTTLLALVVLVLTLTARPLTEKGARAHEHLRGLQLHLDQTSAAERTPLRDRLLPYVVMFARPRTARRIVWRLLEDEGVTRSVAEDPRFVSGGRLAVRAVAVLTFAAALAVSLWVPSSTQRGLDTGDVIDAPGDYGVFVTGVDIDATLVPASDGGLSLDVVETLQADVDANRRHIPQVMRAWRGTVDGHDLGLTVTSIRIDGREVALEQSWVRGYPFVQTRLSEEWPGEHTIEIAYTLTDAVSAVSVDGDWRDQVRWTALLPGWEWAWRGVDHEPEIVRITMRMPEAVAARTVGDTGWLDEGLWHGDPEVVPFAPPTSARGEVVYAQEYRFDDTGSDNSPSAYVGAQLQFAGDSFTGGSHAQWYAAWALALLPYVLPFAVAGGAIACAAGGLILRARGSRRIDGGRTRDVVRWLPPWLTLAQIPLLAWATGDAAGDDPFPVVVLLVLATSIALSVLVLWNTRRRSGR